ncbi:sugar phosphate nucleotidyltransferase, partial [Granulosicoccaceae sp. 1_MG-2023]|nr:sugar phosphate nucleotidyltransferase [Granulosicoccaceae sp. 1_MG-2023]
MFVFRPSTLLGELQIHAPEILQACEAAYNAAASDLDFIRLNAEAFAVAPKLSIDYALMEKTDNAAVVPLDAGWNDVGAYNALWDVLDKDEGNNASRGDVLFNNCSGTLGIAESRLVCVNGVDDLVVIETHDAVLVSSKDKAQDVKALVDTLKSRKRDEALEHRQGFRPWGVYDCIDKGER